MPPWALRTTCQLRHPSLGYQPGGCVLCVASLRPMPALVVASDTVGVTAARCTKRSAASSSCEQQHEAVFLDDADFCSCSCNNTTCSGLYKPYESYCVCACACAVHTVYTVFWAPLTAPPFASSSP